MTPLYISPDPDLEDQQVLSEIHETRASLADYLRGVYAWTNALTRALDELAYSLRALTPDWAILRWRIEEANNFHFDELMEPIRRHIQRLAAVPGAAQLADAVEALFVSTTDLEKHLGERFG